MNMTIDDERPFTEDMKRIVAEQKLAFVATVCPDGTPNLSPKGTIAVWDDTQLVFADIRSPGTVANLKVNPTIEINVVDWSEEPFSKAARTWSIPFCFALVQGQDSPQTSLKIVNHPATVLSWRILLRQARYGV